MIRTDRPKELPIIRVLNGIRNMGYTLESAILDIIDNSIVAGATEISVLIDSENDKFNSLIKKIIISDNGKGMNIDEIYNALELGSPNSCYENNSLSKYGFGLKSAGFSQANTVTVISRADIHADWMKSRIDWNTIENNKQYVVDEELEILEEEKALLESKCNGKGTIVILDNLIKVSRVKKNAAIKKIVDKSSITFHRFMEKGLKLYVNTEEVIPYDPLFCNELDDKSMIDYDGRNVCSYFSEDYGLTINSKNKSRAMIKAVLLPNPPLHEIEGKQKKINQHYRIQQKNIGIYIYRNERLIAEGITLGLFSRHEPRLLASRIRVDLNSNCDDDINLDVKKTQLVFPEQFMEQFKDLLNPYLKRSKDLWDEMKVMKFDLKNEQKTDSDVLHERSNEMLKDFTPKVCDPVTGDIYPMQEAFKSQIEQLQTQYEVDSSIIDEIKKKNNQRIITVSELDKGMLWKPIIGGENNCQVMVTLSRTHPFYSKVYKKLESGSDAVVILDALFLSLSLAEMGIDCDDNKYAKIFAKLRQSVSHQLENFIDLELDDEEDDGGEVDELNDCE